MLLYLKFIADFTKLVCNGNEKLYDRTIELYFLEHI